MARYSLFVKHLPTNIGVEDLQRLVSDKLSRLYPADPASKQSQFVKFRVVGDYNTLYQKCVRLKQNIDKLNVIRNQNKRIGERQSMKIYKGWVTGCCGAEVDAQEYYV